MKRKMLLICMTAVIFQMCFFTGCSDDKSKDIQEISEISAVKTSNAESDAVNDIVLPEMDIEEDDTSETSPTRAVQSDKADKSDNDNKAFTAKAVTTRKETATSAKVSAKTAAPTVTTENNTSIEETTTKTITAAVSSESVTTTTKTDVIELPEIEFD